MRVSRPRCVLQYTTRDTIVKPQACFQWDITMIRGIWKSVSARSAVVNRSLAPAIAHRSTRIAVGSSCEAVHVPAANSRLPPINSFSRNMYSAKKQSKPTGDESQGEGEPRDDTDSSSWGHSRDPLTGEGSWIDDGNEVR